MLNLFFLRCCNLCSFFFLDQFNLGFHSRTDGERETEREKEKERARAAAEKSRSRS
jgi:hypothetical protein